MKGHLSLPEKFPAGITLEELSKNWMGQENDNELPVYSLADKASLLARMAYSRLNPALWGNRMGRIGIVTDIFERGFIPGFMPDKIRPVFRMNVPENALYFGTGRTGKSILAQHLAEQDIRKGNNVIFIDPKGDPSILTALAKAAYETGRRRDLAFINPLFPEYSIKINPLAPDFSIQQQVDHIVSAIASTKNGIPIEPFFLDISYEMVLAICQSLSLLNIAADSEYREATDISAIQKFASRPMIEQLKERLEKTELPDPAIKSETLKGLDNLLAAPGEYLAMITSHLRSSLNELGFDAVGSVIDKTGRNDFIQRLERNEGLILIVQTGSYFTRKTGHKTANLVISMIQSSIGHKIALREKFTPPLSLFIDEASCVMYPGIETLFGQSGQANCRMHCFMHGLTDLEVNVGESQARTIVENSGTKVFMLCNDLKTCAYASESSGTVNRVQHLYGSKGGIMCHDVRKPRIEPEHITLLQHRHFFMFSPRGMSYGITEHVRPIDNNEMVRLPNLQG